MSFTFRLVDVSNEDKIMIITNITRTFNLPLRPMAVDDNCQVYKLSSFTFMLEIVKITFWPEQLITPLGPYLKAQIAMNACSRNKV